MTFRDTGMGDYDTLEEYFKDHPEEENEFIDELARLEEERFIEYPEDYAC